MGPIPLSSLSLLPLPSSSPSSSSRNTTPLLPLRSLSETTQPQPQPQTNNINTNNHAALLAVPESLSNNINNDNAIHRRYQTISIPATTYGRTTTSPPPGTVAGIIIGSVAGFLFLLYLLYISLSPRRKAAVGGVDFDVRDRGSRSRSRSRTASLSSRRRHDGGGSEDDNYVDVMEEESLDGRPHRARSDIIVETETSGSTDGNTVEVMEEPQRPPRRKTRRGGGGAYRGVDPYEYEDGGRSPYGGSRY